MKVIVVGGGVAGLSIGWKLVEAGQDVILLERAQPARAATWAAAGMIAPTAETDHGPQSESEFARWSADLWPDFAKAIEARSGKPIGYKRDGALLVAMTDAEMRAFSGRNSAAVLDAAAVKAREPLLADNIVGALWDTEEAQADNRKLGPALAAAFVRAGGKLSSNEAAVSIEAISGGFAVRTPFGQHHAEKVVLAAGAWTGGIELPDGLTLPSRPVKGEMIALAGDKLPQHVIWGNDVYLVPRDGRLLIGATAEEVGFDTALTDKARDWLFDRAVGLIPSLASAEIDEHWAGLRPGSPDGLPVLGETVVQNIFVATGQFRNGILFAPAVAETVCRLVLGKPAPEIRAFSPQRFAEGS